MLVGAEVRSKFALPAILWAWSELGLERVLNRVMLGISRLGSGAEGLVQGLGFSV